MCCWAGQARTHLVGDVGNDFLNGGLGNDSLNGGAGSDTASYADAPAAVAVSLALQGVAQNTIGAGFDTLVNFENLVGSASHDTLTGNAGPNFLNGLAGNDALSGAAGNDDLNGGPGNDTMDGGPAGNDTASYANAPSAVTVSLALQGSAQNTLGAGIDTLVNFESLEGSAFNDILTGDANGNVLTGLAGNDTLIGGAGSDVLLGATGNDTLAGGAGNDVMDGGAAGNDTVSYADAAAGVKVSLLLQGSSQNTIGGGSDTLTNFENLTGSAFSDVLTGDSDGNILSGLAGNDALSGAAGNDTLVGGAGNDFIYGSLGNDTLTGNSGADSFWFEASFGHDMLTDFAAIGVGHDMINFSTADFANYAAVLTHMAQVGPDVVITYDGSNSLTLKGELLASLLPMDFAFHAPPPPAAPAATDNVWASHSAQTNASVHLG